MKMTVSIAAIATLTACAQSPDAIAPVSMAGVYNGVSCQNAADLLAAERQTLASLDARQRQAVSGDAVGVFLIGIPVSSVSGNDVAGTLAASKGKVLALEQRLMTC